MRYIGNKAKLLEKLEKLIERKNINKTFRKLRRKYYEGERKLGQYYKRRNRKYD